MAFQGVDDVHGGDGLPLGMLCVCYGIPDHVLKEHLEYTTGFFIDEPRDSLDSSSTCKTSDGRLGDSLDVISEDLTVTLGAPLAESLTALTTSCHDAQNVRFDGA